jgi:hypothetical protein
LPTRSRPSWMAPASDRPQASSPSRPPDEVRSILSRYRKGLDDGRSNLDEAGSAGPPVAGGSTAEQPNDEQPNDEQPNDEQGASVAIES